MTSNNHNDVVQNEYNQRANAYLTSNVHASGDDLEQIIKLIGNRPDAIALDMGCGGGHVSFNIAPLVSVVVAYDLSENMLTTVASEAEVRGITNIVTKHGSAENLPCPDNSFDIVVSRYSAHHWQNPLKGLNQMHRALKNGGLAFFSDVITPSDPLNDTWLQSVELLRDPSHVRNLRLSDWTKYLEANGYRIEKITTGRLRLEFNSWITRTKTPENLVKTIKHLLQNAKGETKRYFEIEENGSFTVDTALIIGSKIEGEQLA